MRAALVSLALLAACGPAATATDDGTDDRPQDDGADDEADSGDGVDAAVDQGCPEGKAGAACVIALYDQASAGCDASTLATLTGELAERAELGPLWAGGRALFRTDGVRNIAGTFNDWNPTALASAALCGTGLTVAISSVASGAHAYKLVQGDQWSLDPHNPAFVYDDFAGNADGMNSSLVTPDANVGQLVHLFEACSDELGNCRDVTAYLPPHYDALAEQDTEYPVLFMHDGQNVFDDHDCCFGHTGWEVNVALDAEIAAGRVKPIIVIAAGNTTNRNNEYGLDQAALAKFLHFQVAELQPQALERVRWDGERVGVAGSSLGGLVSMHLALANPTTYRAAASLSGAFWPGQDDGTALRDVIPGLGKQPLAIYLDHGGNVAANSDGAGDSVEVADLLVGLGWQRATSPDCSVSDSTLCYFHEPGATHDELAWKARTWRFLRFMYPN